MNKESALQEVYDSAFNDELEKVALIGMATRLSQMPARNAMNEVQKKFLGKSVKALDKAKTVAWKKADRSFSSLFKKSTSKERAARKSASRRYVNRTNMMNEADVKNRGYVKALWTGTAA